MRYPHLMLDLETMGHGSDAAIVQIGAVAFSPETTDQERFFCSVSLGSAVRAGGVMDASTVLWWMRQSEGSRLAIANPKDALDIAVALQNFTRFFDEHCDEQTRVWGNGADFDNVILRSAYRRMHLLEPWGTFRSRCYRTKKDDHRGIPIERIGTHHNALSDAMTQADHLLKIFRAEQAQKIEALVGRGAIAQDQQQQSIQTA